MPVVEEDELVMIQYSPQHMRTITMDENPLFYKVKKKQFIQLLKSSYIN